MADPDFAKGAAGPGSVYDSSASGLGLSPSYLANLNANAQAAASGSGGGGGGATSGDYADIPAAGDAINEFYYATDTGLLWFSDGFTWVSVPDGAIFAGEGAGGVLAGNYPNPSFAADMATQAELNAAIAAAVNDGDTAGGVLAGTYPNPSFAADMATQTELNSEASTRSTNDAAIQAELDALEADIASRYLIAAGSAVVTTNSGGTAGQFSITFAAPFPTTCHSLVMTNGDVAVTFTMVLGTVTKSASGFTGLAMYWTGFTMDVLASTNIRVDYVATGF